MRWLRTRRKVFRRFWKSGRRVGAESDRGGKAPTPLRSRFGYLSFVNYRSLGSSYLLIAGQPISQVRIVRNCENGIVWSQAVHDKGWSGFQQLFSILRRPFRRDYLGVGQVSIREHAGQRLRI